MASPTIAIAVKDLSAAPPSRSDSPASPSTPSLLSPGTADAGHPAAPAPLTVSRHESGGSLPSNDGEKPPDFDPTRRRSSVARFFGSILGGGGGERRGSHESPIDRSPNGSPRLPPRSHSPGLGSAPDLARRRPSEIDPAAGRRRPSAAGAFFSSILSPFTSANDEGSVFSRRGSVMSNASSQGDMDAGHGSRLSDYKIGSTLGKGRFAVVKAAVHLPTGRPCAVKIIDKPPSGSASALKVRRAFQNEVALLYSVRDHPNVLHIFAHFETPSKYYLVTEQLHGGELWDRISKSLFRPFEEHDAAVHALVIASTLAHLHDPDRAIVHRDLKTPNLVYRAKPTTGRDRYDRIYDPRSLVLVDFGIARRWWLRGIEDPPCDMLPEEQEREREREEAPPEGLFGKGDEDWEGPGIMMTRFCGSPLWMAPEIVRGHGYGREVDLWSLGVICYGLLTGIASPLPGLSATGNDYLPLLHPPSGGIDYPSPPLSEAAISFLNGLLCWNPKERMTAGMCLEHKWITDVVGGDWKRWESLVRAWAGKRAADRREAAESPMAIAGLGTGEGEMAGEAGEWRVTEWADIVS